MRRQFRELWKLFLRRFLENDLVCLDGDTTATLAGILAVVAMPGIMFPVLEQFRYGLLAGYPLATRDLLALPEKALYVSFSMTVLGIFTVLEWDTLLPDRRDYLVLRPLPVRLGMILAAKAAALASFWAVFTALINAHSSVAFPLIVVQGDGWGQALRFIGAHAAAVLAGNAFVFLFILGAQGLLMNLLGYRRFRQISPGVQLALIALLLVMFFSTDSVAGRIHPRRPAPALLVWFPPAWFVGLYQRCLGWPQPVFRELAEIARLALLAAAATAVGTLALGYQRHVRRSLETSSDMLPPRGRLRQLAGRVLDRVALRSPAERAAFHFVSQTLRRSRRHRALLAAWVGGGCGLMFHSLAGVMASGRPDWWREPRGPLLAAPLVLAFFLLCGMRHVFTVPSELRANWLFRISGRKDAREFGSGIRKAAVVTGILPLFGALLPAHVLIWGWARGCTHVLCGAVAALLLLEVLLAGFAKLPFTCSYVPGKANLKAMWSVYVLALAVYVSLFAGLEGLILQHPWQAVWLPAAAGICRAAVRRYQRSTDEEEWLLRFDDRLEPAVRTLQLSQP